MVGEIQFDYRLPPSRAPWCIIDWIGWAKSCWDPSRDLLPSSQKRNSIPKHSSFTYTSHSVRRLAVTTTTLRIARSRQQSYVDEIDILATHQPLEAEARPRLYTRHVPHSLPINNDEEQICRIYTSGLALAISCWSIKLELIFWVETFSQIKVSTIRAPEVNPPCPATA